MKHALYTSILVTTLGLSSLINAQEWYNSRYFAPACACITAASLIYAWRTRANSKHISKHPTTPPCTREQLASLERQLAAYKMAGNLLAGNKLAGAFHNLADMLASRYESCERGVTVDTHPDPVQFDRNEQDVATTNRYGAHELPKDPSTSRALLVFRSTSPR